MKRLNFKLFILALISNVTVFSQTATDPLTNAHAVVSNTDQNKMFFGQLSCAGCCGNDDNSTDERVLVTYEALNLFIRYSFFEY